MLLDDFSGFPAQETYEHREGLDVLFLPLERRHDSKGGNGVEGMESLSFRYGRSDRKLIRAVNADLYTKLIKLGVVRKCLLFMRMKRLHTSSSTLRRLSSTDHAFQSPYSIMYLAYLGWSRFSGARTGTDMPSYRRTHLMPSCVRVISTDERKRTEMHDTHPFVCY